MNIIHTVTIQHRILSKTINDVVVLQFFKYLFHGVAIFRLGKVFDRLMTNRENEKKTQHSEWIFALSDNY